MATALSNQDLRSRMRRLEERLFRDCDTRIDVQLHAMDQQAYRDALRDAILAMQRARAALVAVVQRG